MIIPTRNEALNLGACLRSVRGFARVIVVDSGSTDGTAELARDAGAEVHQFAYEGGWPKKRQWAMDHLAVTQPWTLLLDADERVTPALRHGLAAIVARGEGAADGYWVTLRMVFLGRVLRHGASGLQKLCFFRTGRGRFECLVEQQDERMGDVEIHEHVMVQGREARCRAGVLHHENFRDLHAYIHKHNEYSTWSAMLAYRRRRGDGPVVGRERVGRLLGGSQADRRRFMMDRLWRLPGGVLVLPVLRFAWFYCARLGFLDGWAGFYYCAFKGVQSFHIMAKLHELELNCKDGSPARLNASAGGKHS